ncbi:MAG: protein-L-isoaspartate O-methyltransferase [Alphaproteobacteria bacterium]|nr:protein-L-isoaspartate O-methyltransferase [Alphaproteobacteria bacterium]
MSDPAIRRRSMVQGQVLTNKVTDEQVTEALLTVPREAFVPRELRGVACVDEDLPLAPGRYLMEPMVLARLLQVAELKDSESVLNVGCGTGYVAAVLARLAGGVVALESQAELAARARQLLAQQGVANVVIVEADLPAGHAAQAPYDAILIEGAVECLPAALPGQLAEGGRLICIERTGAVGHAVLYRKVGGLVARRELFDAQAPLLPGFSKPRGFRF